jgi:NAD(P)-dependent dehydrogenase (short-subunit alcohol dehydrogenase family)
MLEQSYGNIINITSILGLVGLAPDLLPRASYIAAKHGVIGLTRQLWNAPVSISESMLSHRGGSQEPI